MADKKISSLTELTTLATNDEIVIVDKSDTTQAASGTTKKRTVDTLDDYLKSTTKTLTNKTIDADNNTISNLETDNFKSSAFKDDDTMADDSETAVASQQSIKAYVDNNASSDGWIPAGETWTYASASTFTISGDKTDKYQKGDKIKLTQTTAKYFYVTDVSESGGTTTVTVTGGTDYTVANAAITSPYYSKVDNPQGFPHWFNYTPSYSGNGSLTFTSVTTDQARFSIAGKICTINLYCHGTVGGTGSTVFISPPITFSTNPINYTGIGAGACGTGGSTASTVWRESSNMGVIQSGGPNWSSGTNYIRVMVSYEI